MDRNASTMPDDSAVTELPRPLPSAPVVVSVCVNCKSVDGAVVGPAMLDPENGKEYRASFTPVDGGKKLEVRGYLGPFWRTQTWNRVQ